MNKLKFLPIILSLSGCCHIFASEQNIIPKEIKLSNSEIDLLVGTPEGISEPLDSRRNSISRDNQIDYSSFLDENALIDNSQADLTWEDAEDNPPNENQVENQLLDLLAETEELEKTDEILYHKEYEEEQASYTQQLLD